ncbi:hypothetical protein C8J56DRAFT_1061655 [Mycena floridula]|nr:hypothetical protein C8J56DRAFT_1061655 [Mycena floridula]
MNSYDKLALIHWSKCDAGTVPRILTSFAPLPQRKADGSECGSVAVYHEWLTHFVSWVRRHREAVDNPILKNQDLRAAQPPTIWKALIKDETGPFSWVGVYTVSELLNFAGMPPWVRLDEILSCPSRLARLAEAGYFFSIWSDLKNEARLRKMLKYTGDGTLTASKEDAIRYTKDLTVYGKVLAPVSALARRAFAKYNEARSQPHQVRQSLNIGEHDIFQPDLYQLKGEELRYILNSTDDLRSHIGRRTYDMKGHCGHLIFERYQCLTEDEAYQEDLAQLQQHNFDLIRTGNDPLTQTDIEKKLQTQSEQRQSPKDPLTLYIEKLWSEGKIETEYIEECLGTHGDGQCVQRVRKNSTTIDSENHKTEAKYLRVSQ